jgi:hypothetical protein
VKQISLIVELLSFSKANQSGSHFFKWLLLNRKRLGIFLSVLQRRNIFSVACQTVCRGRDFSSKDGFSFSWEKNHINAKAKAKAKVVVKA